MPALARRAPGIVGAGLALLGVVLAAAGLWLAVSLGPDGEVSTTKAIPAAGALEITPSVLNTVDVPVGVLVTRADRGPLWAGVGAAGDASAVLGSATHTQLSGVHFPSGAVTTTTTGAAALPNLSAADVWRVTSQGTGSVRLMVGQGHGPESVVVAAGDNRPLGAVTATITWQHRTWFFEALAVMILGGILAAFALAFLWQRRSAPQAAPETVADGDRTGEADATREADRTVEADPADDDARRDSDPHPAEPDRQAQDDDPEELRA